MPAHDTTELRPRATPAGLILVALADRAGRRLHGLLSRWARERAAGASGTPPH